LYDPAEGNLLLDIRIFARDPGVGSFDSLDAVRSDASTSRLYADDVAAITAGVASADFGLVTQFTFVPEPSAFAIAAGLLLAGRSCGLRQRSCFGSG
jgi:hypothetical protein